MTGELQGVNQDSAQRFLKMMGYNEDTKSISREQLIEKMKEIIEANT